MSITQVAVLLIRLSSLSWFIECGLMLTYLPNDIFGVRSLSPGYLATQREIDLTMKLIRFLLYGVAGMIFNIYAIPLARVFTKGLENLQLPVETEEVWPPAPRSMIEHEQIVTRPGKPAG